MAISYYDDAITQKIKNWLADTSKLRVLSPDESNRLIQLAAEDSNDKPLQLPLIAISRNKDIEIESVIKQNKSFDGLILGQDKNTTETIHLNVIPIKTTYQLDIYTKKRIEADEYVRQYLFKLINNPQIIITIPYNGYIVQHTANLRVLNTVSDTSDISTHVFSGQFYKWTIQLELQDGFLFSIPRKRGWTLVMPELEGSDRVTDPDDDTDEDLPSGDDLGDSAEDGWESEKLPTGSSSGTLGDDWEIVFGATV